MQKSLFRILAAAGTVAAAPLASAQVLADGSFETSGPLYPNPAPWTQSSTNFGTPLCNGSCTPDNVTLARTGLWWAWFGGNLWGAEHGVLSQDVNLPAGRSSLNFFMRADTERSDGTDHFTIKIDTTVVYSITDLDIPAFGTGYHPVSIDLSPFAGGRHTLTLECMIQGNNVLTDFHIDDVSIDMACYANCDGSSSPPILSVNDFNCFLNKFSAGDPYANCDGSTAPPILNINDFTCFMSRFTGGCPG